MGEGFIRQAAGTFRKKRDKDRLSLVRPDLFTVDPTCGPATALARLHPGVTINPGDDVCIEMDGQHVGLYRAGREIGVFRDAPEELLDRLRCVFGAMAAVVVRVNPVSSTASIAIGGE